MLKNLSFIRNLLLTAVFILILKPSFGQGGFDNPTRALYIFDLVAQYVNYGPGFADSSNFKIGVLVGD